MRHATCYTNPSNEEINPKYFILPSYLLQLDPLHDITTTPQIPLPTFSHSTSLQILKKRQLKWVKSHKS